jgi:hypothetical protein
MEGDQQILKVKFPSSFGGHMVAILTMHECARGRHKSCPGSVPTRPGEFGGTICQCPCHKGGIPPKKEKGSSKSYWKKLAKLARTRAAKLTLEIEEAHLKTANSTLNFGPSKKRKKKPPKK